MDSSLKNPSYYHQRQPPSSAPFPPPPPLSQPSISHQFHHNYSNFTHRQGFPPLPAINQPPLYYSQPPPPPHVCYESPWISQPSSNFDQSACVGYMGKRIDSRIVSPNYQLDYGNRTKDCFHGVSASDLDCNFRFRDRFSSLGYARKGFGDFIPESDGYCTSLGVGTSLGHGNAPFVAGNGGTGNQRWVEIPKDDYYRSEIEPYFDNGKTKGSDDMNRTANRFKSFKVKRKETRCIAGNVLMGEVTKKKESFPQPTSSDIENLSRCSEGGVPFAGRAMSSFQSQPCEDELPKKDMDDLSPRNLRMEDVNDNSFAVETNTTTRIDSLDGTVVSQAESQACENGVNSSVENVSRKQSMETKPLNSTAEVDQNLGSDAGKYTCRISISSSPKSVAGKGSSNVQPVERTSVLLSSIDKNKDGWSNGLVVDRELSSAVYLEDVSFAPNQDLGLSSHDPAEIPSVDQSCNLDRRGLKSCSSESYISLRKGTNVDASEFHFNQEDKEKSPTCSSLPVSEIGNMDSSGSETDSECAPLETQPCQAGRKVLPNDHLGCGSSDVVCSMDKDMVDDPLRISSCLVPDGSISSCHLSPSVSVNERSKTTLSSISEKTQKRANKYMHSAQERYPRSQSDTKKDANPPINVTKHRTWHRKSDTSASPLVAVKPKVTAQSSSTYVRKGNSLLRKPSPGYLGEAQTLQRHSRAPSDCTSSGKCALSSGMDPLSNGLHGSSSEEADDPDYFRNGLKSSDTLAQTGYASDCQPQNLTKLESLNPSKMLYAKRKANQLVAASDIHGASTSEILHSGGYFKRSKNQLVRNSESLVNQAESLPDDSLDLQTGEKMVSKRSSSSAVSEFAVMRPFNRSNFSLVWTLKEPLSRKANGIHTSPQKIVPQPASVLQNGSFSSIGRKFLMMRKRRTVYRRSTNGHSLKRSKVASIGGSHLKLSKSVERDSKKPEFLSDVESWRSAFPECGKDTKKSFTPRRLVIGNDESVWIRNGLRLGGDPKKRTRVLANEKVRWSLHNVRLRLAKKRNYCQFFTRFGKCNKDDGKCPYIHDPSKIAVCTKFVSRLCASPDCKLTHKVVPERMPDCSYFLQGVCNNEPCLYRHVHVNQKAAICKGFLRGYCSDGNECRKKHTYTCPVFEVTESCPQETECKLHHPKNRSKGIKRKRENEPWQRNSSMRYFGSMHKSLPECEPMLVNELAADGAFFGGEGLDFIRLDRDEHEASQNMDSSPAESASDDSEAHDSIDELIRPVGLMQK